MTPTNLAPVEIVLCIECGGKGYLPVPVADKPRVARTLDRDDVPLVDSSHDCKSCRAQSNEFYDLTGRCLTCGQPFIVRSRKGDKPPLSVDCPNCEVAEYSWRSPAALAAATPERDALDAAIEGLLGTPRPTLTAGPEGIREWELAAQRLRTAYRAYRGEVTMCPVPSSVTGQPCLLSEGHPQDSATRFHRFAAATPEPPKDDVLRGAGHTPLPPDGGDLRIV